MVGAVVAFEWRLRSSVVSASAPSRSDVPKEDGRIGGNMQSNRWYYVSDTQTSVVMPFKAVAVTANFSFNLLSSSRFIIRLRYMLPVSATNTCSGVGY